MGIYYNTRFLPNGKSHPEEAIDIAHTNRIIEEEATYSRKNYCATMGVKLLQT